MRGPDTERCQHNRRLPARPARPNRGDENPAPPAMSSQAPARPESPALKPKTCALMTAAHGRFRHRAGDAAAGATLPRFGPGRKCVERCRSRWSAMPLRGAAALSARREGLCQAENVSAPTFDDGTIENRPAKRSLAAQRWMWRGGHCRTTTKRRSSEAFSRRDQCRATRASAGAACHRHKALVIRHADGRKAAEFRRVKLSAEFRRETKPAVRAVLCRQKGEPPER